MVKIGIFGLNGSGKSTLTALIGLIAFRNGRNIFTNFHLNFPPSDIAKVEIINPLELLEFQLNNCCLLLDEIETFIDSRINPNANRYVSYFWIQARKRKVDIVCNSQLGRMVDCRAIMTLDAVYIAESTEKDAYFHYSKWEGSMKLLEFDISKKWLFEKKFPDLETKNGFFDCFDTTELIYPPEMLGRSEKGTTFNEIQDLFEDSPNKVSFSSSLRIVNPYITVPIANSVYDYLKDGKTSRAKRLLHIKE